MRILPMLALSLLAVSACASSAPRASDPTSTSEGSGGGETESTDTSADAGTDADTVSATEIEETTAPVTDLTTFPAPVRARLEALPALPVSASTPVLALTLFDASLICGFLDQHVRHEGPVSAACPDGSPVLMGGECNPASVIALRRTFDEACALRLGDYLACEIAARASPCSVGFMRADLPECEAVNACLATQVPAD